MLNIFLVFLACLFSFQIDSYTVAEVFAKFPNRYFIESGTFIGDGIQNAIDAGFETIYSIELSETFYKISSERFKDNKNVHILKGDSEKILKVILKKIDNPATFWLDGHWSGGETALGSQKTPILKELSLISTHHIKNHTILIDDIRCCGTPDFDNITLTEIIDHILRINPDYIIHFEDGYVPQDVLVAEPPL
jgi:hypothetical protein